MNVTHPLSLVLGFGTMLLTAGLSIWIACVVFRHRSPATWMVMIGAVAAALASMTHMLLFFFQLWDLKLFDSDLRFGLSIHLVRGAQLAEVIFLAGLLLHLQRRKLESERVAQLEAILRERPSATGGGGGS